MAVTLTPPETREDLVHVSIPILKWEQDEDGDLIVKGIATDGTVDSDAQIVDPQWSAGALHDWIATGGNVRMSHDPHRPVGKGLRVDVNKDNSGKHWVTSVIVDPVAQKLIRKGVLTAYSVGISRPVIQPDPTGKARGGVIVGGELAELSVVDRPSNKSSYLQLAKSAEDGTCEFTGKMYGAQDAIEKMEREATLEKGHALPGDLSISFTPNDLAKILHTKIIDQHYEELAAGIDKRDFDANVGGGTDRDKIPDEDFAGKHRSFPIVDQSDVSDALQSIGRAGSDNYDAATLRNRIIAIAHRKGFTVPGGTNDKGNVTTADEALPKEADPDITKDPQDDDGAGGSDKEMPPGDTPWMQNRPKKGKKKAKKAATADKCDTDPKTASGAEEPADMDAAPLGELQESPMPAGLKAADITSSPEASALLRFKTIGIDTDLGRLHDLTCPAFDPDEVAKYHPYADFMTVIDQDLWMRKAVDAACGPLERAMQMTQVWSAAQLLHGASDAELNDYRREAHKAFRDANPGPSTFPTPGSISPQRYSRPFITEGHATCSPGHDGPTSSPQVASSAPSASGFDRPPLSSGHQSPSPSFMKASFEYPREHGTPVNLQYASLDREKCRQALSTMHDHLSHMFPSLCPMLDQDPNQQPQARPVNPGIGKEMASALQEAAITGKAVHTGHGIALPPAVKGGKKLRKKLGKKVLSGKMTVDEARTRIGRTVAQKQEPAADVVKDAVAAVAKGVMSIDDAREKLNLPPWGIAETSAPVTLGIDPEIIKAAVADAVAPLLAKVEEQQKVIETHEQRWEAAAEQPDPRTAAYTGLALNPLFKNARPAAVATTAEIAERTQLMIRRQLDHIWRTSENPAEREAAYAELSKHGITE